MGIELPNREEVRDDFKKRVTVLIATITFFGTVVAFLQTRASNKESVAVREGEINAVRGIGAQLETAAETTAAYEIFLQASEYDRRASLARAQARSAGEGNAESRALATESLRWEQVKAAITPLTPLLSDEVYAGADRYANPYYDDKFVEPGIIATRQAAQSEVIGAWGSKANSFFAVLTTVAVSLFLLGLSLTIGGTVRRFLVAPAVGIFGAAIIWTLAIVIGNVPRTPEEAIEHIANGDRLLGIGHRDYNKAIAEYSKAIEIRPDYALAYERRANAHVLKGSREAQQGAIGFVSLTEPENLQAALRDGEKAISLGLEDTNAFGSQGFNYFLVGDYRRAERLTRKALELNPRRAHIWANLGLIAAARGSSSEAEVHYSRALRLIRERPSFEKTSFLNAARTDLEILSSKEPARRAIAKKFRELMTLEESEISLGRQLQFGSRGSVKITKWESKGAEIFAHFDYRGLTKGAATAYIWYFRPDSKSIWAHDPTLYSYVYENPLEGRGSSQTSNNSRQCPTPGQYRLDVYENGKLIGSGTTTVKPGVLGEPVLYQDEILAFSLCRPKDWKVDTSQSDSVAFEAPDGSLSFRVGTLPVGQFDRLNPVAFETSTVRLIAAGAPAREGDEGLIGFKFGGVQGRIGYYVAEAGGRTATRAIAASFASDGVLRTMIATATEDQIETLNELLDTLKFTNAPQEEDAG